MSSFGILRRALSGRFACGVTALFGMVTVLFFGAATCAEADAFARAAGTWLHGDEAEALSDLRALAQQDDTRALLLLGLIDKTPSLQGPWLARLPRAERLALLRAPGGMSGRSWLTLAGDDPLAQTWLSLMRVEAGLETALRFAEMGEARAARQAVITLAVRERLDLGGAWPDGFDPELAWLTWPGADTDLRAQILDLVPEEHPQRAFMRLPVAEGGLQEWLATSPAARPLQALCDAECPESRPACLSASYAALGSHASLLMLGSPAERLIPDAEFLESARGRAAVLRRILLAADARGRARLIESARRGDACFGELMAGENARYRYIRDTTGAATNERSD